METITNLIKDTPIPKMVKVRQNFDKTCIPESDIPGIITRELDRPEIGGKIQPGQKIAVVGGGIGMAPIRTIMLHLLEHKADYGKISLLYGARSPRDMAFSYELEDWLRRPDLDCTLCIDAPFEGWEHKVGLIPNVLLELNPDPANCVAVLCGPPIMIKFVLAGLEELGFSREQVYTTLELRMKCGVGKCGRCNIGDKYVCKDGPVFRFDQLDELPNEY